MKIHMISETKIFTYVLLLFFLAPVQAEQFLIQRMYERPSMYIHKTADALQPKDDRQLLADFTVSGLRVRVITMSSIQSKCSSGQWRTIYIDGPVNKDTSFVLDKLLSESPICINQEGFQIRSVVAMNSSGGQIQDGYAIGRILRKYRVSTALYKGQTCASACAIAFLGGETRRMFDDSRLVFHAPYTYKRGALNVIECSDINSATPLLSYYQEMIGNSVAQKLFERTMDYCSISDGWILDPGAAEFFGITSKNTQKPVGLNTPNAPTEQWVMTNLITVAKHINNVFLESGMLGLSRLVANCYSSTIGKDYICYMIDRAAMTVGLFNPNPGSGIDYFTESAHANRVNNALRVGVYDINSINLIQKVMDENMSSILLADLKAR